MSRSCDVNTTWKEQRTLVGLHGPGLVTLNTIGRMTYRTKAKKILFLGFQGHLCHLLLRATALASVRVDTIFRRCLGLCDVPHSPIVNP